jgi:hypothetical protein
MSLSRLWGNNSSIMSWKVLWIQWPDKYTWALGTGMDADDRATSDIEYADYDYDMKGLYMLMTYQEDQDNLLSRHDER